MISSWRPRGGRLLLALSLAGCSSSEDRSVPRPVGADSGREDVPELDLGSADEEMDGSVGAPDLGPTDGGLATDADPGSSEDGGEVDGGSTLDPLVGRGELEVLGTGFQFVEGPRWFEGRLLFSDIPADRIYVLDGSGQISVFREPSNNTNGIAVDRQGRLLTAEHGSRQLTRTLADGQQQVLASEWEGLRLNSPNDLVVGTDGTIYFTDPPWGIVGEPDARELAFNGVFRIDSSGALSLEWSAPFEGMEDTPRPNGIALNPDETRLYVADDRDARILVFDVAPDRSLSNPRLEVPTRPIPDGMAIDEEGNLFVATSEGIEVFDSSGGRWGLIPVPGASNVAFGDDDARGLYITAQDRVLRIRLQIAGIP